MSLAESTNEAFATIEDWFKPQGLVMMETCSWEYDEIRTFKTEEWCYIDPIHVRGVQGYEISTLGRSCNPNGIVRSPVLCGNYPTISIKGVQFLAHRLVALTFLENENVDAKKNVNHIDGNKCNPSVDNLEFCSNCSNFLL